MLACAEFLPPQRDCVSSEGSGSSDTERLPPAHTPAACLSARPRERETGRQAESHPHFPNLSCCLRFQSGVLTPKTTRDDNKTCCFSKSTTHIEIKKTRLSVKIQAYLHVYPASSSVNYAKITVYGEYLRLAAPVISIFS